MRYFIHSILFAIIMLMPVISYAQDDEPLVLDINYGMTVEESITDHAFFDWWQLQVESGDSVAVSMQANDGLQPLLGLLDSGGTLVARSDTESAAEVNGVAYLQYDAPTAGQYTVIATRDGRDQGMTTGRYRLTVTNRSETQSQRPDPFMETEFRCEEWLLTNALTFEFTEDDTRPDDVQPGQVTEYYRISVYGLDGFEPVIRILSDVLRDRPLDCTDSAQATAGSLLDLPFLESAFEVTEDDADHVAMVTLTNSGDRDPLGDITITVGAKDGTAGRFIVVLEGMTLHQRTDTDEFRVRRGPFASDTTLDTYMIGYPDNRLDSLLEMVDLESDAYYLCDDLGRDDCADVPALVPSKLVISEDGTTYSADRFDAGLRIDAPDNTQRLVTFQSRERSTSGNYLVMFVGELPARD